MKKKRFRIQLEPVHPDLDIYIRQGEVNEGPGYFYTPTFVSFFIWIRVIEGTMFFDVGTEKITLQQGEVLFINSNQLHLFKGTQGKKIVYRVLTASTDAIGNVHLGKKLKKMINDDSFAYTVIHPVSPLFSADMDAIFDLKNHQPQEYEFEVLAKYLGMLRQIYRIYCHANPDESIIHNADLEILREMMAYVGENYQEDITVDALAREGNVSRSKCTRLFREYLQQSPIEYVQNYRLERSVVLLRTTNASLSEVARKCGFNQQSYFNRLFMRKFHMTPKQMRIKE